MTGTVDPQELYELSQAILRKLDGCFPDVSEATAVLRALCKEKVTLSAGSVVVAQDGSYSDVFLLESGWALRSRHLVTGARQIVNTIMPGDFLAFNAVLFTRSDFELRCKTDVEAYRISSDELNMALGRNAALSALLFWVNGQEESMMAERIVSLGRRTARQRAAHVLCELISRMELIDGPQGDKFTVPLSQDEFADILGISVVHMNKTLQSLAAGGIIKFRNMRLTVHDRQALEHEAGFDSGYLHFTRRDDWRSQSGQLIA